MGLETWDLGLGLNRLDRILKDQIILKLHIEMMSNITPIDVIEPLLPVILIHCELLHYAIAMAKDHIPQNEGRNPVRIRSVMNLDMGLCGLNPFLGESLILLLALGHQREPNPWKWGYGRFDEQVLDATR